MVGEGLELTCKRDVDLGDRVSQMQTERRQVAPSLRYLIDRLTFRFKCEWRLFAKPVNGQSNERGDLKELGDPKNWPEISAKATHEKQLQKSFSQSDFLQAFR